MQDSHKDWYRTQFRILFLEKKQNTFQDFFADIMERAHPADFKRTRAAGQRGDRGCDGFQTSIKTAFQVYAPRQIFPARLHEKLLDDLAAAHAKFGSDMHGWILVHNDTDGLSTDTTALLEQLGRQYGIAVDSWSHEALWTQIERIPDEKLHEVLPRFPYDIQRPAELPEASESAERAATSTSFAEQVAAKDAPQGQLRILRQVIDTLADTIRKQLDAEGLRLWDEIRILMESRNYSEALAAGARLETWLNNPTNECSPEIRGRAFILLADLDLIAESKSIHSDAVDTTAARRHYDLARQAFGAGISEEDADRLIALDAKLLACSDDAPSALRLTDGITSPGVVAIRLAVLLEQQDWAEASKLVEALPLHERWADSAIIANILHNKVDLARRALEWSRGRSLTPHHRCVLSFARTTYFRFIEQAQGDGPIVPGRLPEEAKASLEEARKIVEPACRLVLASDRISSGLEAELVATAMLLAHLLGETELAQALWGVLNRHDPIHVAVANGVQAGIHAAPSDLPARLRRDHPHSLDILILAAYIEGVHLNQTHEALQAVKSLFDDGTPQAAKERMCALMCELSCSLEPEARDSIDEFLVSQLGESHQQLRYHRIATLMAKGQFHQAEELIKPLKEDQNPDYLQLASRIARERHETAQAAELQIAAARILSRIEVWHTAANLADQAKRPDLLEEALRTILAYTPTDDRAQYRLGILLVHQQRFGEAASCFETLQNRNPDEPTFPFNRALCLRHDGRPDEAISILDRLCSKPSADHRALLMRAQILRELGKTDRALQSLKPFREAMSGNPEFLLGYLVIAYSAGQDESADEALAQVIELKRAGQIPDHCFRSASLDETIQLIKFQQESIRAANRELLTGRAPWLLVEIVRNFPPYLGWHIRTQPLIPSDDPDACAAFTIYATNHFAVRSQGPSENELLPIECPSPGTGIVADLTALLTLHRLDLFDAAIEYFSSVQIPASYIPTLAHDSSALSPNQPSIFHASNAINQALQDGRIKMVAKETLTQSAFVVIDEYAEFEAATTSHRLGDLFRELNRIGHLSNKDLTRAESIFKKKPPAKPTDLRLARDDGVVIAGYTLQSIARHGFLEVVTKALSVHLPQSDADELRAQIRAFEFRDQVLEQNKALADKLSDPQRFTRLPVRSLKEDAQNELSESRRPIHALGSALDLAIPLFADDRTLQTVIHNARRENPDSAFGTDAFVRALLQSERISVNEAAAHFLKLIEWRYRFVVPPAAVLHHWAREYTPQPPGRCLAMLGNYVHDCMRDPGLLGGLEPTNPPISIAMRLWREWVGVLAEFLVLLWLDPDLNSETKQDFTRWTVNECLPLPPISAAPLVRHRFASLTPLVFFSSMLMSDLSSDDFDSLNEALLSVRDLFGLTDAEFIRIMGEIVNVPR